MKIRKMAGLLLVLLSFFIVLVSAFVYDQASQTTTQTITDVASLSISNADLGPIEEGETIVYPTTTPALDNILSVTTTKDHAYLYIVTDLDTQSGNYDTYQIEVIVDTAPGSLSGTVATLTIVNPSTITGIDLDTAGGYTFDFQVTTTAQQVSSDTPTTVNIDVSVESS
jgi:hypothetical protein